MIGRLFVSAALIITAIAAAPAIGPDQQHPRQQEPQDAGQRHVRNPGLHPPAGHDRDRRARQQWWRELNLGSPEAILKIFVQRSGCFGIVNRGRSMQSRAMERALADNGELQQGSNVGRGQVKTADYFLEPNIVSANRNSGGGRCRRGGGRLGRPVRRLRRRGRRDRRRDQRQEGGSQRHASASSTPAPPRKRRWSKAMPARRTSAGAPAAVPAGGAASPRRALGLPEYRDRPGHRAGLSRRLYPAGDAAGRPSRQCGGGGPAGALSSSQRNLGAAGQGRARFHAGN